MLAFRPSEGAQQHARTLLQQQNEGTISREEQQELDELAHAERLVRLIKALLHSSPA
jgi:hypothetical protein